MVVCPQLFSIDQAAHWDWRLQPASLAFRHLQTFDRSERIG